MLIRPMNHAKLQPVQAAFCDLSLTAISNSHCTYEIWHNDSLQYVGVCKLADVFAAPDARSSPDFIGTEKPISLSIKWLGSRADCYNARGNILKQLVAPPPGNIRARTSQPREILCNETGERFATQSALARAIGTSQGNIAQHLSGKPGHRSIKGCTYRYVYRSE